MRRREFMAMVAVAAAAWPVMTRAEQARRRVVLISALPENDAREQDQLNAFRDDLRKLGWVDGQNVVFESLGALLLPSAPRLS